MQLYCQSPGCLAVIWGNKRFVVIEGRYLGVLQAGPLPFDFSGVCGDFHTILLDMGLDLDSLGGTRRGRGVRNPKKVELDEFRGGLGLGIFSRGIPEKNGRHGRLFFLGDKREIERHVGLIRLIRSRGFWSRNEFMSALIKKVKK